MTLLRSIVTLGAAASAILVPLLGGHALATGEAGGAVFALATFAAAAALCFLQSRLPGGETPRRSH